VKFTFVVFILVRSIYEQISGLSVDIIVIDAVELRVNIMLTLPYERGRG
jgi:hypothetical protein